VGVQSAPLRLSDISTSAGTGNAVPSRGRARGYAAPLQKAAHGAPRFALSRRSTAAPHFYWSCLRAISGRGRGGTHANDLAAFLRQLDVGPAHLVGWSYGADVVLVLAVQHPALVRSLFLYEPSVATFVTEPADLKAVNEEGEKMFAGGIAAVRAKDEIAAVRASNTPSSSMSTWRDIPCRR
jgi:pimeloyl-ACP methyl ester carboxylesterase